MPRLPIFASKRNLKEILAQASLGGGAQIDFPNRPFDVKKNVILEILVQIIKW
jgi:hypothetical protein